VRNDSTLMRQCSPREFRAVVLLLLLSSRFAPSSLAGKLAQDIWLNVLSFCHARWFSREGRDGGGAVMNVAAEKGPLSLCSIA
jgi:hypothetical protein